MTKGKNKKNENYENLFVFAATPSLSGREGRLLHPPPPNLFHGFLKNFFFIDTLVSRQRVGKLAEWRS